MKQTLCPKCKSSMMYLPDHGDFWKCDECGYQEPVFRSDNIESLRAENAALKARVAEMEAAARWIPGDKPENTDRFYLVTVFDPYVDQPFTGVYPLRWNGTNWLTVNGKIIYLPIVAWRELPAPYEAK